ncbi:hypothetical protein WICANDRAFT_23350, partial [Wickerhamomyces anomalus NRRL Y-366-8]
MLIDLNIHWPQKNYQTPLSHNDIVKLKNTLVTLEELGYTHIALNYTLNHSDKIPSNQTINPINLDLLKEFQNRLKIYTRVTIIVDEPSQGQSISKLQNGFDIVSVLPISEKGLLLACNSLDIDLITFDYSKKLPTFLKQKTIGAAIKRGVKFEITYSNFLKNENRPQFINNTLNLIRASRNQNLVVSSGAQQSVELRSFPDVLNLLQLLNFKQSDGNNLIDKASKVLLNGRLRIKSYKQTVMIGEDV